MTTKYCLPIIKNSIIDIKKTIDQYPNYDGYEVWVDYLDETYTVIPARLESLSSIFSSLRDPGRARSPLARMTLCFRRLNGEPIHMPVEKRINIIDICKGKNIFIDCDIEQQNEDLEYIRILNYKLKIKNNSKVSLIASYHNYKQTPAAIELNKIIKTMEQYNPEIYKIATFCQTPGDAVRLMQLLLQLKKEMKKAIVLGMGNYGKISRIFGAMYGNEITFTPENGEKSAPGQMTRDKISLMIKDL